MTSQVIPAEAVEAAKKVAFERYGSKPDTAYLRTILEAAAPHIAGAWHDAVSEAYVEGALSLEQASVMWNKNPYRPTEQGEK